MQFHIPARLEQMKRKLKEKWSLFSSEDLENVAQDPQSLQAKLKEKYQLSDEEAAVEAQRFNDAHDSSVAMQSWNDLGQASTHEPDHPEKEIIRKDKDNGSYTDPRH